MTVMRVSGNQGEGAAPALPRRWIRVAVARAGMVRVKALGVMEMGKEYVRLEWAALLFYAECNNEPPSLVSSAAGIS